MKLNYPTWVFAVFSLSAGLMAEQAPEPSQSPSEEPFRASFQVLSPTAPVAAGPVEAEQVETRAVEATPPAQESVPIALDEAQSDHTTPASSAVMPQAAAQAGATPPAETVPAESAQPLSMPIADPLDQTAMPADMLAPATAEVAQPTPVPESELEAEPETESAPIQPETPTVPAVAAEPDTTASSAEPANAAPDCDALTQRSQMELDKLQVYVAEVNKRLEKLRQELSEGDKKRRQQEVVIESLQKHLDLLRQHTPEQDKLINQTFAKLAEQLPESPVFRVENNRLIIMTDFILAFGRGEVSTEGKTRLQIIAYALRQAAEAIPAEVNWRWRVEGHSDTQPLRSITWFPSNWELSAARASGIARYLMSQGIPAERFRVAALGATQPIEPDATTKDAHWRNRRVEIHLVFGQE